MAELSIFAIILKCRYRNVSRGFDRKTIGRGSSAKIATRTYRKQAHIYCVIYSLFATDQYYTTCTVSAIIRTMPPLFFKTFVVSEMKLLNGNASYSFSVRVKVDSQTLLPEEHTQSPSSKCFYPSLSPTLCGYCSSRIVFTLLSS